MFVPRIAISPFDGGVDFRIHVSVARVVRVVVVRGLHRSKSKSWLVVQMIRTAPGGISTASPSS